MPSKLPSNAAIASVLERIALLLEAKEESPFRIRSYRNAAASVRASKKQLASMVKKEGEGALTSIKGIGERLAGLIGEYVKAGEVELLTDLEKEVPKEKVEEHRQHELPARLDVPVSLILAIDEEYRRRVAANTLKKIAPRQHNPERKAWLPILTTDSRGYKFTVMFSNTARAHELGKTDDWTVVYFQKGKEENQCTVVTETRGPLKGKRVIRGEESRCREYYGIT